jgi:hypothetical protein
VDTTSDTPDNRVTLVQRDNSRDPEATGFFQEKITPVH